MATTISSTSGETQSHRDLKRLALIWAQQGGYRLAAAEVSLPQNRVRMDVAACKVQRVRVSSAEAAGAKPKAAWKTAVAATAIFECKASAADYVRDARSQAAILERLRVLQGRKARAEEELKIHYPSIRNGDSLFPEFETLNFERPGYERYVGIIEEIRRLDARLHQNTKFERLTQARAANLFYLVTEPGLTDPATVPCGWGILERRGEALALLAQPHWHEVTEETRFDFMHRIALAATRAVNREHGITLPGWEGDPKRKPGVTAPARAIDPKAR